VKKETQVILQSACCKSKIEIGGYKQCCGDDGGGGGGSVAVVW
jgi:hypothetical protein